MTDCKSVRQICQRITARLKMLAVWPETIYEFNIYSKQERAGARTVKTVLTFLQSRYYGWFCSQPFHVVYGLQIIAVTFLTHSKSNRWPASDIILNLFALIRGSYRKSRATIFCKVTCFIFPHNRHFFVHISPSVLEVWKIPCGRTPFQPSEDTDALLSELPPFSHL